MKPLQWSNEDPREHTAKRQTIVVLNGFSAWVATVETKHSYSVFGPTTSLFIDPDDKWPDHWLWVRAPEQTK